MEHEYREQITNIVENRSRMLKQDINHISIMIQHPFSDKCENLDRTFIYNTATLIEEIARRIILTCSLLKSICRLIPTKSDMEHNNAN